MIFWYITITIAQTFNIAVDFGGVLSVHDSDNAEHKNTCIDVPNGIESLEKLKNAGHKLYLVSFCGKKRAKETKESIETNKLDYLFEKQIYVKNTKFKRPICELHNCHFMIDDRTDILGSFVKEESTSQTVPILFGSEDERFKSAQNWNEVVDIIEQVPHFEVKDVEITNVHKLVYDV